MKIRALCAAALIAWSGSFFFGCAGKSGPASAQAISDQDINTEAAKVYEEVKRTSKLSTNKEATAMVKRVADRIARASGENFDWEVILIEDPQVNAWCMPGGKMAVYTGILPVLQNEGALAAVLGHEVSHATLRHGKVRYARAMQQQLLGLAIAAGGALGGELFCKSDECRQIVQIGGAAAGLAMAFFDRKFSREEETEADMAGQTIMARAGYAPSEAIRVWERMAQIQGGQPEPPEFLSTHPSHGTRQENLASWLPEAQAEYEKSPKYGTGQPIPGVKVSARAEQPKK